MWHTATSQETCKKLITDPSVGLSASEVRNRLLRHGENKFKEPPQKSFLVKIINQMSDYMVIILLAAAAISFFVSFLNGETDFVDPIMILAIVILNSVIGVIQENKAEHALSALKNMTRRKAKVLRGGNRAIINSENIVPGDILYIESGDIIPADARIISATALRCNESALTGESEDIEKSADVVIPADASIGDRQNMVWQSCVVTGGRGTAVVTATGMNTQAGKVAGMLIEKSSPKTPLQLKLAHTGKILGITTICICAVIFSLGILNGTSPMSMFMTAVSLAVAIIPEGLPAIITVVLSLGMRRMASKGAIVRKMSAVETLGSATVICSDKTGTLTEGKMTVTDYFGKKEDILRLCVLCNNQNGATEKALLTAGAEAGISVDNLLEKYVRVDEIPFNSTRKMMSIICKTADGYMVISKGAPEIILSKCKPSSLAQSALETEKLMAKKGLRVLAVAKKHCSSYPQNPESDLEFEGLIALSDPPRRGVKKSVEICKNAGIKPVMITGDFPDTAAAIARETGICEEDSRIICGGEIDTMNNSELCHALDNARVFARVTPEHKMRIVQAYQSLGKVVAMTGDGVNDAPALKSADIGCAMGKAGTDVAKEAADIVLTDDNFSTIVTAVKEGRGIYDNVRKTVHFLLSCNVGEMFFVLVCVLLCKVSPFNAICLLWINLITDSLPAIALGMEKPEKNIMLRKPVANKKSFFTDGLIGEILFEGFIIAICALIAFLIGNNMFPAGIYGSTMAFAVMGLSQLIHALNIKSKKSVFSVSFFKNKFMLFSFAVCSLLQIAVIQLPPIAEIFELIPLEKPHWICVAALSCIPLVLCEIQKLICKIFRKQP